ncbi:hypothetical protein EDF56_103516 [Novosphingobium sp. PhB165]|uniref:hypothetical protein n=1 Tax=Novosphingobium sp. PhB165 TaxID=2485105 RepID=UPI0010475A2E|nr:hypothetical protein [Novosphingobium sp. PhB165]TCM19871.1 hypothetical protein EDF56_103516 [Novosphingobium sp. PhB165]
MRRTTSLRIRAASVLALALGLSLGACKQDKAPVEPTASTAVEESEEPTEAAPMTVEDWIRAHNKEAVSSDLGKLQYATAEVDLDGDGTPEVLAYLGGPMLCGTGGCNLVVLKRDGTELRKVSEISVVQLPVGVLNTKTNGWRDLAVTVAGGGVTEGIRRLPFDGKTYAENATVAPATESATIGKELIPEAPLKPLD